MQVRDHTFSRNILQCWLRPRHSVELTKRCAVGDINLCSSMPGLYNASSWVQLPLESSCVTAYANGYSMGLNAHLTYLNPGSETVQAIFIYLLDDGEVVTGFEATTGNRKVQAQVHSQSRMEECCTKFLWDCLPCLCPNGHLILDSNTAHGLFILSVGAVPPSATLSVNLRSSRELKTLTNGAVHVILNSTLTPFAPSPGEPSEEGEGLCDDSPTSCFGGAGGNPWVLLSDSPLVLPSPSSGSLSAALSEPATNVHRYKFSFRLEVQGPCLLAGIESTSHALRADASPFALSASSVWISLAEEHECNRALEIILHLSEPYIPHLCLEKGRKSFSQYKMQIRERGDFIRAVKKSSDPERQVSFVRRRFHKDLHFTPVLMLNFCPDLMSLSSLISDLPTITREIIFLVYHSGELSHNFRDALLLAVRSLPARTLLNLGSGTCDSITLFQTSRQCSNESLEAACDHIKNGQLSCSSSNLVTVLGHILTLPVHRGYPRQLFLFTDTSPRCPGRVIELLTYHAKTTRVFGFGLDVRAGHRFLEEAARVSSGTVELLGEGERLQPKLIKSLKKALEPALSDITIDWYMPDTMEALLTPNEIAPLYPGGSLISYCALYHTASFRGKRDMRKSVRCGSFSSVFESQEDSQVPESTETSCLNPPTGADDMGRALQEISHEISMEFSACSEKPEISEDSFSDIRKRIVRSSYVKDQYVLTHCSVSTEPTHAQTHPSISSDPTYAPTHGSTSSESVGSHDANGNCSSAMNSQQGQKSVSQMAGIHAPIRDLASFSKAPGTQSSEELVKRKALMQATMSGRSFSSPHGELDMLRLRSVLDKVSQSKEPDKRCTRGESLMDSCQFHTPSNLDWDMLVDAQYLFSASPAAEENSVISKASTDSVWQCRAVIRGLLGNKSHSWEASISLQSLLHSTDEESEGSNMVDSEFDLHHLAAQSVIKDNEDTAWRVCDIEHGSSRRYRLKAIQTSKSCSQISTFTSHMPVDLASHDVISEHIKVCRGWRNNRIDSTNLANLHKREHRSSENMDELFMASDDTADFPSSPRSLISNSGSEKKSIQEGHLLSAFGSQKPSDTSLSSRISNGKRKIRSISGKLSPLKTPCLREREKEKSQEFGLQDYLPLISLQSSEGYFTLNSNFSSVVKISLERLLRASPYSCHRGSLSPGSEPSLLEQGQFLKGGMGTYKGGSQPQVPTTQGPSFIPVHATSCPEALCQQADSGRGSETDPCETSPCPSEVCTDMDTDLEGWSWATAVALAWLEHCSAGFFTEWEVLAAKAEVWLRAQVLPDGLQISALKGAARHLFLLLRHWDENLNLNMLCYKPGDV
ncbi:von Willebrand factor A domain-containing protein 5B2 isoform X2 [Xenopus laevis]|uniref:von Willebrand factor A domain-containing protein 5B2 isoform X2 n=2 Tax=Xenopus laevis TaxID=8355 RepID=A0A8J0VCS2_XENLA|nr:von Willebrand factor A domain-containing protein 5B2 isoform X2 [Xenopus laevis]